MKYKFILLISLSLLVVIAIIFALFSAFKSNFRNQEQSEETLPQTSKYDSAPTVVIDAGHGGEDCGTIGFDGTLEKNLNLEIALELERLLRAEGIKTVLTRNEDILLYDRNSDYYGHKKEQDMAERLRIANNCGNFIFISIHMNYFTQSKYKGLQVYYSPNSPASSALAQNIQSLITANLQHDNTRKIKSSDGNIYLLDKLSSPAVLVECGFLSNEEDCANLNDAEYRSRMCLVLFSATVNYINSMLT